MGRKGSDARQSLWLLLICRDTKENRSGYRRNLFIGIVRVSKRSAIVPSPDETFEVRFAKDNASEEGFNRWTIDGRRQPMTQESSLPHSLETLQTLPTARGLKAGLPAKRP